MEINQSIIDNDLHAPTSLFVSVLATLWRAAKTEGKFFLVCTTRPFFASMPVAPQPRNRYCAKANYSKIFKVLPSHYRFTIAIAAGTACRDLGVHTRSFSDTALKKERNSAHSVPCPLEAWERGFALPNPSQFMYSYVILRK
jgi:hypothetical protein